MNSYEIKNNGFTNFFLRHPPAILSLHRKGLQIFDGEKKIILPFSRLHAIPQIRYRVFWSHLFVSTAKKTYLYKGFSSSQLRRFLAAFSEQFTTYIQEQLKLEYREAKQLKAEIRHFLDASTFRRHSQSQNIIKQARDLLARTSEHLREQFASAAHAPTLKYLADFISAAEGKVARCNAKFMKQELLRYQSFFDGIEKNPLTLAQRQACITGEDHNLVLAGAGTGKTSTLIGRTGYLIASEQAAPEHILMLAFARKAAEEMQLRQDQCLQPLKLKNTPVIKTFHALGLEIIGTVEGAWPQITLFAENRAAFSQFINQTIDQLMAEPSYQQQVYRFCDSQGALKQTSEFSSLMLEFLVLFKQSQQTLSELTARVKKQKEAARSSVFLSLFSPVLMRYEQYLSARNEIDFADMIGKAIKYVESGRFVSPYRHILVDEFQDISQDRARLLKALLAQKEDAVLFAVGDDWQSIYRFTGSDINITRRFSALFGATAVTTLDLTFRFNNQIGDVASTFIRQNPEQIPKEIRSVTTVNSPTISLIDSSKPEQGLERALTSIVQQELAPSDKKITVAVLARFNFMLDNIPFAQLGKQYPQLDIQFMSVHASKGKEADHVIVLGLNNGKYGFPSQKETDPVLALLLPEQEKYPYAEERRLFYVALTRAKNRVYLVYNSHDASPFIHELISQHYPLS
ncbi:DNA helicase IV [Tolumonas lignilytica]|uniref:DNA helicase IV n=1 Tax=Tolumonas lignilytica TaxID=1283284 RepID=UPI000464E0B7|nr:DNA helicase IV [Tolumonas lignilytica]